VLLLHVPLSNVVVVRQGFKHSIFIHKSFLGKTSLSLFGYYRLSLCTIPTVEGRHAVRSKYVLPYLADSDPNFDEKTDSVSVGKASKQQRSSFNKIRGCYNTWKDLPQTAAH
jgi:hypothetical protein